MDQDRWHYVYYSYEECGRGYIGKRSSKVPPGDDPYLGSFTDKTFQPTHKIVIAMFDSSEDAIRAEIALHHLFKVDKEPHFANRAIQSSPRFYRIAGRRLTAGTYCPKKKHKPFTLLPGSTEKNYVYSQEEIVDWDDQLRIIQDESKWLVEQGRENETIKLYPLRAPNGVILPVTDISSFAKIFNLNEKKLNLLAVGAIKNWRGWTRP
jgi:hypothetical protein